MIDWYTCSFFHVLLIISHNIHSLVPHIKVCLHLDQYNINHEANSSDAREGIFWALIQYKDDILPV